MFSFSFLFSILFSIIILKQYVFYYNTVSVSLFRMCPSFYINDCSQWVRLFRSDPGVSCHVHSLCRCCEMNAYLQSDISFMSHSSAITVVTLCACVSVCVCVWMCTCNAVCVHL